MTATVACNYATIQFLPYRETGEFVNIGVLLFCPQTGYFNAKIESRKQDRVTNFFPEIDEDVFRNARQFFEAELQRVQTALANDRRAPSEKLAVFRELVKPRESMFRFGGIATVLAENPAAKLDELFDLLVKRILPRTRYFQEIVGSRK